MRELADRLRASGIDVPIVSVGSTPTITAVDHLEGIDEARPGNYIFFDAFQATAGSLRIWRLRDNGARGRRPSRSARDGKS